jgi:hypothetical protein
MNPKGAAKEIIYNVDDATSLDCIDKTFVPQNLTGLFFEV